MSSVIYKVFLLLVPVRYTKHRTEAINLCLAFPPFFSGCNLVFQKFNRNLRKNIISLTFLCIVPSTWKNIGGVQEKLGSELSPGVDKSLVPWLLFKKSCFSKCIFCFVCYVFFSCSDKLILSLQNGRHFNLLDYCIDVAHLRVVSRRVTVSGWIPPTKDRKGCWPSLRCASRNL